MRYDGYIFSLEYFLVNHNYARNTTFKRYYIFCLDFNLISHIPSISHTYLKFFSFSDWMPCVHDVSVSMHGQFEEEVHLFLTFY